MELLIDGDPSPEPPSEAALERWFAEPRGPAEFLVLRDPARGEVRATAPQAGTCLVQAELQLPDRKVRGEAEVEAAVAREWCTQFLRGELAWHASLHVERDRSWHRPALLLAALGFLLMLANRMASGCS